LENWQYSGQLTFTFNGSIAALFASVYATNTWQLPDNYYGIPTRAWAFNTNFLMAQGLPPLTPLIINSNIAPAITLEPTNQDVNAGESPYFTVAATGFPPVTYQWYFDETNAIGINKYALWVPNAQSAQSGDYMVLVSNILGSVLSANVTLFVSTSTAPIMNTLSFSEVGGFQFTVHGVPGSNYMVLVSSNLVDWVSLTTNNAPFNFADTNLASPYQFYRSAYLP
jgi:hypothetical protein